MVSEDAETKSVELQFRTDIFKNPEKIKRSRQETIFNLSTFNVFVNNTFNVLDEMSRMHMLKDINMITHFAIYYI